MFSRPGVRKTEDVASFLSLAFLPLRDGTDQCGYPLLAVLHETRVGSARPCPRPKGPALGAPMFRVTQAQPAALRRLHGPRCASAVFCSRLAERGTAGGALDRQVCFPVRDRDGLPGLVLLPG